MNESPAALPSCKSSFDCIEACIEKQFLIPLKVHIFACPSLLSFACAIDKDRIDGGILGCISNFEQNSSSD
jgi:hypothetical protein